MISLHKTWFTLDQKYIYMNHQHINIQNDVKNMLILQTKKHMAPEI